MNLRNFGPFLASKMIWNLRNYSMLRDKRIGNPQITAGHCQSQTTSHFNTVYVRQLFDRLRRVSSAASISRILDCSATGQKRTSVKLNPPDEWTSGQRTDMMTTQKHREDYQGTQSYTCFTRGTIVFSVSRSTQLSSNHRLPVV